MAQMMKDSDSYVNHSSSSCDKENVLDGSEIMHSTLSKTKEWSTMSDSATPHQQVIPTSYGVNGSRASASLLTSGASMNSADMTKFLQIRNQLQLQQQKQLFTAAPTSQNHAPYSGVTVSNSNSHVTDDKLVQYLKNNLQQHQSFASTTSGVNSNALPFLMPNHPVTLASKGTGSVSNILNSTSSLPRNSQSHIKQTLPDAAYLSMQNSHANIQLMNPGSASPDNEAVLTGLANTTKAPSSALSPLLEQHRVQQLFDSSLADINSKINTSTTQQMLLSIGGKPVNSMSTSNGAEFPEYHQPLSPTSVLMKQQQTQSLIMTAAAATQAAMLGVPPPNYFQPNFLPSPGTSAGGTITSQHQADHSDYLTSSSGCMRNGTVALNNISANSPTSSNNPYSQFPPPLPPQQLQQRQQMQGLAGVNGNALSADMVHAFGQMSLQDRLSWSALSFAGMNESNAQSNGFIVHPSAMDGSNAALMNVLDGGYAQQSPGGSSMATAAFYGAGGLQGYGAMAVGGGVGAFMDSGMEKYSRKVFVGGLPPDIDEDEITAAFSRYGSLVVDWPHKAESKSYFPPKGYAFIIFQQESSVQNLIEACHFDQDKYFVLLSSPTVNDKAVQIRPWKIGDADYVLDASLPLDPRKTVFVGGVPRPLKAEELALVLDRLYGGVCYAGIDTDPELKYPKGAGRVAFANQHSYIAAISARFVHLQHKEIDKRVEVKPYVLDDQMCDECMGSRCQGKYAPFFCANVTCLQYYCDQCWTAIHSKAGREFHKPLVKEGSDRPRVLPNYRWT